MAKNAGRLEAAYPRPYDLTDHFIGIRYRTEPMRYYETEAEEERKSLLKSGLLVVTRIPIPTGRSEGHSEVEVHKALFAVFQRTGDYYSADVQKTNGVVVLVCRPRDVESFASALK